MAEPWRGRVDVDRFDLQPGLVALEEVNHRPGSEADHQHALGLRHEQVAGEHRACVPKAQLVRRRHVHLALDGLASTVAHEVERADAAAVLDDDLGELGVDVHGDGLYIPLGYGAFVVGWMC